MLRIELDFIEKTALKFWNLLKRVD